MGWISRSRRIHAAGAVDRNPDRRGPIDVHMPREVSVLVVLPHESATGLAARDIDATRCVHGNPGRLVAGVGVVLLGPDRVSQRIQLAEEDLLTERRASAGQGPR